MTTAHASERLKSGSGDESNEFTRHLAMAGVTPVDTRLVTREMSPRSMRP
jgi:hypothetical protein